MTTWPLNELDYRLEVAFGFSPADADDDLVWVDVSDRMAGPSPALSCTRGRAWRSTLTPGEMPLTFLDDDGWWRARTDLLPGVPARAVAVDKDTDAVESLWRGYAREWTFSDDPTAPTLDLACHDVIGLINQSGAPETAFAAAVAKLSVQPDAWWRPGASAWEDRIGGASARHTGGLVEMDPVVDGDSRPGGSEEPEGYGIAYASPPTPTGPDWQMVSMWVRRSDLATPMPLFAVVDGNQSMHVVADDANGSVLTIYTDIYTYEAATKQDCRIKPGVNYHVQVAWRVLGPSADVALWINGVRLSDSLGASFSTAPTPDRGTAALWIGHTDYLGSANYAGVIDHVMTWSMIPDPTLDNFAALDTQAATLYQAGTQAWAGQSMDQRAAALVDAADIAPDRFQADLSGVLTRQGYRTRPLLESLQAVEDTEQGLFWVDRHGCLRFSNRGWAWTDLTARTAQAKFVDDSYVDASTGEWPMRTDLVLVRGGPDQVQNVAAVNSEYGRQQTAQDVASIALYGRRSAPDLTSLLHPTDRQSRAIAEWIVTQRSNPFDLVDSFSFDVEDAATSSSPPLLLSTEDGDPIVDGNGDAFLVTT